MMADKAHYYSLIQNLTGDLQPGSSVRVLEPGTEILIAETLYSDNAGTALTNPFISEDGAISIYLDQPKRVDLGITVPGLTEVIEHDIDVLVSSAASIDQTHTGSGSNSTAVGAGANSGGAGSVALGNSASATGLEAMAMGHSTNASGQNSVAIGSGSVVAGTGATAVGQNSVASATDAVATGQASAATANNAIAVGDNTIAAGQQSTVVGSGASVSHLHASAFGAGAATTQDNQVMLGTPDDYVALPSFATLKSPNGTTYRLYVRDDGTLNIRYHYPIDGTNLLTTGNHDDDFEGSTGNWVATNATIAVSTVHAFKGTQSMLATATAAGAFATSIAVPAVAGHIYVGKAQMYRHAGDGTATQFQAWALFYDGSNVLIGTPTPGPTQTIVNDTWMPIDVRVTAPANTATMELRVGVPSGQGASGGKWYTDVAGIFDVTNMT